MSWLSEAVLRAEAELFLFATASTPIVDSLSLLPEGHRQVFPLTVERQTVQLTVRIQAVLKLRRPGLVLPLSHTSLYHGAY